MQVYEGDAHLPSGSPAPRRPGSGRGRETGSGAAGRLPHSGIQDHGDRDIEPAEGFGHFLTENDILKALEKTQESSNGVHDMQHYLNAHDKPR